MSTNITSAAGFSPKLDKKDEEEEKEDAEIEQFRKKLEAQSEKLKKKKSIRMKPNVSTEWIVDLRRRLNSNKEKAHS